MDPTFVLAPSPLLGPAVWAPVAIALARRGHEVVETTQPDTPPSSPAVVADRLVDAVPADRDVVLVVHSNAGLYAPTVVARRPNVTTIAFVDAGLPPPSGGVALAPAPFLDHLRTLVDDADRLPPWTAWFAEDDVAVLFPGRSLAHLIDVVDQLADRNIEFRSLTEGFDTSTSGGRLVFHVFAAVAEFERQLVRERTMAGLDAAKRQGRTGRRPSVMTPDRLEAAQLMRQDGHSLRAIAAALNVSSTTIGRHLRATNGSVETAVAGQLNP